MIWIIILVVLAIFFSSYQQLSGLKTGGKSKFLVLDTKIENIKTIQLEHQKVFQIISSGFFQDKKLTFSSPKYYFDITKNLKIGDNIKVELNTKKTGEYRFLDDQLFD